MDSSFDWPWPPTPSTSLLPTLPPWPLPVPVPVPPSPTRSSNASSAPASGDASPASDSTALSSGRSQQPGAVPSRDVSLRGGGGKRMSCAACRASKMKCVWVGEEQECAGCVKRGVSCAGPAPRANNRRPKGQTELVELIPKPNTALIPTNRPSYTINSHYNSHSRPPPPPFSPYRTAAGRARNLSPSSSEATLNSWARAGLLRADLIDLYRNMWPLEMMGLPVNAFEELFDGRGDEITKALNAICTAIGARSSSHSEIVQQVGPSLTAVDDDLTGQFVPGGFSEWGLRRQSACFALGTKAVTTAAALVEARASFKTLKLALAAATLAAALQADRNANRPFTVLAIRTWRKLVVDPATTAEEMGALMGQIGPILLLRDRGYAFTTAEPTEFTAEEAEMIVNTHPVDPEEFMFGIPDCSNPSGLVVFDENVMLISCFKQQLLAMHTIAVALARSPGLPDSAGIARLREIHSWMDQFHQAVVRRLADVEALAPELVFVVHEWGGSWRPNEPKQHAVVLVAEIAGSFERVNEWTYAHLSHASWADATLEQSVFRIELRERCRAGIKGLARSCRHWLRAPRKHANFASLLHETGIVPGWVELALGRFGEPDGPLVREDELTVEEVELIVRGLRLASFSQGSLVVVLREMERGLEELRREERESERLRQEADVGGKSALSLNLDDFLFSLNYGSNSAI